mmetsp:Transcript_21961/g.67461  ORF Transcript_21961/g.67461 Transcript_21961/m.67461 type:complete len:260 (-) Transcript_21961:258-1037(-)
MCYTRSTYLTPQGWSRCPSSLPLVPEPARKELELLQEDERQDRVGPQPRKVCSPSLVEGPQPLGLHRHYERIQGALVEGLALVPALVVDARHHHIEGVHGGGAHQRREHACAEVLENALGHAGVAHHVAAKAVAAQLRGAAHARARHGRGAPAEQRRYAAGPVDVQQGVHRTRVIILCLDTHGLRRLAHLQAHLGLEERRAHKAAGDADDDARHNADGDAAGRARARVAPVRRGDLLAQGIIKAQARAVHDNLVGHARA